MMHSRILRVQGLATSVLGRSLKQTKIWSLLALLIFAGCDSGLDCSLASGGKTTYIVDVADFSKLTVYPRVAVVLIDSPTREVRVETTENLVDELEITVTDGRLELRENTTCNVLRDYAATTIFVSSPGLTEVRNASNLSVSSQGTLDWDALTLITENTQDEDLSRDGTFDLDLDLDNLRIVTNGPAVYQLRGTATIAHFGTFAGDGRILARDLVISDLDILHSGTNIHEATVTNSVTGTLSSVGDFRVSGNPTDIRVEELFTGRLILD